MYVRMEIALLEGEYGMGEKRRGQDRARVVFSGHLFAFLRQLLGSAPLKKKNYLAPPLLQTFGGSPLNVSEFCCCVMVLVAVYR